MLLNLLEVLKIPLLGGIFGVFIGIYIHAKNNKGKIRLPRKLKYSWDLGFLYDCMESAFGAFALVLVLAPSDLLRVSIVALLGALNADKVIAYLVKVFNQVTNSDIDKSLNKDIDNQKDDSNKDVI